MSQAGRHVDDLVAAYVLGAVTPAEAALVETHLAQCPACTHMADELRAVAEELPAIAPAAVPSPFLKQRIMAAVRADAASAHRASSPHDHVPEDILPAPRILDRRAPTPSVAALAGPESTLQRARARRAPGRLIGAFVVAAAAIAAAIGSGLWHLPGFGPSGPTVAYAMAGLAAQPSIKGTLTYSITNAQAELNLQGLSRLAPGHVYELWFIRGHYRLERPIVSFAPNGDGHADLRFHSDNPSHYTMACLTVERTTRARVPTMPLVALAAITH